MRNAYLIKRLTDRYKSMGAIELLCRSLRAESHFLEATSAGFSQQGLQ